MSSKCYITSPEYRKAPASVIETIIGGLSAFTMILAVAFAAAGDGDLGFLMFIGSIFAFIAVTIKRVR